MSDTPFVPPVGSYAVIFTSVRNVGDHGYDAMAERMMTLVAQQPGLLGVRSVRGADGLGITLSYWDSLASIASWRRDEAHQVARNKGRSDWYSQYELHITRVERGYSWRAEDGTQDPMTLAGRPA